MVEESYVSFETARLLKEKGFAGECDWYYPKDGWEIEQLDLYELNYCRESFIEAPSLALVMRWLREVHDIHLEVGFTFYKDGGYYVVPILTTTGQTLPYKYIDKYHSSYEDAVEAAIKYCLENLI